MNLVRTALVPRQKSPLFDNDAMVDRIPGWDDGLSLQLQSEKCFAFYLHDPDLTLSTPGASLFFDQMNLS